MFIFKNGEELTQTYLKNDVLLLTCVFQKFVEVSVKEFGFTRLYCTLQDKGLILALEKNIRGGIDLGLDFYDESNDLRKNNPDIDLNDIILTNLDSVTVNRDPVPIAIYRRTKIMMIN